MSRFFFLTLGFLPLAAAAPAPLVIDPAQSHIDIVVKATVGSFVGKLPNFGAVITVDSEKKSIEQVAFGFHFSDIQTGNSGRDKDMLEWEQAAKFPDARFVLSAMQTGAAGKFQASGTLTLHGQFREITFPVTINQEHDLWSIDGEVSLDTREFGLPILRSYLLLTVNPIVRVRFHIQGNLARP